MYIDNTNIISEHICQYDLILNKLDQNLFSFMDLNWMSLSHISIYNL